MTHLTPHTTRSRNLVRFARHLAVETMDASFAGDYAFRDAGSRFSVLKSPGTTPGPDECLGLYARDARPLFAKLLGLKVSYDGLTARQQEQLTDYNAMNYYRSHVVEHFCQNGLEPMPPTEGESVFWFAKADVLCVRYRLTNKSEVDVPVHLSWESLGEAASSPQFEMLTDGLRVKTQHEVGRISYRATAQIRAEDGDVQFVSAENGAVSTPAPRVVPALGQLTCRFAIRFSFNDEPMPDWPADLWEDTSLEFAISATESCYEYLPELRPAMRAHGDLTLKAAGTLRHLRYLDRDLEGRPIMTIHAGKTGCAATYFWDTAVTLPGLALMQEREAASGALRLLLGGIAADGRPTATYENQAYHDCGYQFPILAWGAGHYLQDCPDDALLASAYEGLSRYVRHWLSTFNSPWGVIRHPTGGTCLDDAVRWHAGSPLAPVAGQAWHKHDWGRPTPRAFACPDISAFLVLELRTLAAMAQCLNRHDDIAGWLSQAEALAAAINTHLLEPETQTYQDRHIDTGVFNGMVHMGSFIPIYAGIAPPEIAEQMCRNYLLSPDHFLTELPFPVIDRAHPTFRSGGFLYAPPQHPGSLVQHSYWRGRTWIHANSWYLGALWQSGFQDEAESIADRILTAVSRSEGISECYDSLTGFSNGHPEFMWSSAAVLMIAHGFYKRPPVASFQPQEEFVL